MQILMIFGMMNLSSSPNTSAVFQDAAMVMSLAEKFNMTRFKPFQKQVIDRYNQLVAASQYAFSFQQCTKIRWP